MSDCDMVFSCSITTYCMTNNIIEIVDSPVEEALTLSQVKAHLRLNNGSAEDDVLSMLIASAREQFEFLTDGRTVLSTTFDQHCTSWQPNNDDWHGPIELVRGKVSSLISVKYYDTDNVVQTLSDVVADVTSVPALVYLPSGNYPNLSSTNTRPVTVRYIAGWSLGSVPKDVQLGMLLLVGHWYERREAYTETEFKSIPMGFEYLCQKYKTGLGGW